MDEEDEEGDDVDRLDAAETKSPRGSWSIFTTLRKLSLETVHSQAASFRLPEEGSVSSSVESHGAAAGEVVGREETAVAEDEEVEEMEEVPGGEKVRAMPVIALECQ